MVERQESSLYCREFKLGWWKEGLWSGGVVEWWSGGIMDWYKKVTLFHVPDG